MKINFLTHHLNQLGLSPKPHPSKLDVPMYNVCTYMYSMYVCTCVYVSTICCVAIRYPHIHRHTQYASRLHVHQCDLAQHETTYSNIVCENVTSAGYHNCSEHIQCMHMV